MEHERKSSIVRDRDGVDDISTSKYQTDPEGFTRNRLSYDLSCKSMYINWMVLFSWYASSNTYIHIYTSIPSIGGRWCNINTCMLGRRDMDIWSASRTVPSLGQSLSADILCTGGTTRNYENKITVRYILRRANILNHIVPHSVTFMYCL